MPHFDVKLATSALKSPKSLPAALKQPDSLRSPSNSYRSPGNSFREEEIGASNYTRITVPPNIWKKNQNNTQKLSLVLNVANLPHDPAEVERKMKKALLGFHPIVLLNNLLWIIQTNTSTSLMNGYNKWRPKYYKAQLEFVEHPSLIELRALV